MERSYELDGLFLPNACGKGIVGTRNDGLVVVGVNTFPLYTSLARFACEDKSTNHQTRDNWRDFPAWRNRNLVRSDPEEIKNFIEKTAQVGDFKQGQFGGVRMFSRHDGKYSGQTIPEFIESRFAHQTPLYLDNLFNKAKGNTFGQHREILGKVIDTHSKDAEKKDITPNGGFYYATPVLNGHTVLTLFGYSESFGKVQDLEGMNRRLAIQLGFVTPEQYMATRSIT